jgi:hypothetical protein
MDTKLLGALGTGFLITSLLAMLFASDFGERIQLGWASIWCPSPPKLPTLLMDGTIAPALPEEDDMFVTCHDRILDATTTMSSVALGILVAYALFMLWHSFDKKSGNNNYGNNLNRYNTTPRILSLWA